MEYKKPLTLKVRTPLEKELARLKGYNSSEVNAANDVTREFNDSARRQKDAYLAERSLT